MVRLQLGEAFLDTDNATRVGFKYTGGWVDGAAANEKCRTFDLSVPATPHNGELLQWSADPVQRGMRHGVTAVMITGWVWIQGTLYLTGWAGGRYSLLFIYGHAAASLDGNTPHFGIGINLGKDNKRTVGGTIPDFGLYSYENTTGNTGSTAVPLDSMPVVNLGYLLEGLATAAGYTVTWPAPSGWLNPHSYGLVLPTVVVEDWARVTVTGCADQTGGFSTTVTGGGGTLASIGLQITGCWYRRGSLNTRRMVYIFRATAPVTIRPANNDAAYVGGEGYDVLSGGEIYAPFDHEFDLNTGEYFTLVAPSDAHRNIINHWHWHQTQGYEGAVNTAFEVLLTTSEPTAGMTLELDENLPDITLKDGLNAFCDIICGVYDIDPVAMTITVDSLENVMQAGNVDFDLNTMRVVEISSVKDYIDGWAQHNIVRCKSAEYVQEHEHFKHDYEVENDYLDDERIVGEIPWNEGGYSMGYPGFETRKIAYLDDITIPSGNAPYEYKGVLTIICESPAGCPALHLQTVTDDGVGVAFGRFTKITRQVEIKVEMPLFRFVAIRNIAFAHYNSNTYVIRSAEWSEGVARLTLLTLDPDPLNV